MTFCELLFKCCVICNVVSAMYVTSLFFLIIKMHQIRSNMGTALKDPKKGTSGHALKQHSQTMLRLGEKGTTFARRNFEGNAM